MLKKAEKTLGSVQFAVVIIVLFALALIYGTFMESYHGAEYANRLVYKSLPFFLLQFSMFLSIFCATLLRLPMKKHLYGFYVLHLGLLLLFLGSFITYKSGIDGNLTLPPNLAQRKIVLNEDEFEIKLEEKGVKVTSPMPFYAGETHLNYTLNENQHFQNLPQIRMLRFLPFAQNSLMWRKSPENFVNKSSAQYQIYNDRFSENVILSMNPLSDYQSSTKMGLLNLHYMPEQLYPCFILNNVSELVIWDSEKESCFTPESRGLPVRKTPKGERHVLLKEMGQDYHFFPELSPIPMKADLALLNDSAFRIFSLKFFKEKPHLFLFGQKLAFYDESEEKWVGHDYEQNGPIAELPWMSFNLRLTSYHKNRYPVQSPEYVKPTQDNGQIIIGNDKAIEISVDGQNYWIRQSDGPMQMILNGEKITFELKKKEILLPYEITLNRFVMKTDPGTQSAASYESFIGLFDGKKVNDHHVYMNHPLKYKNFTFYQASYFESQEGGYGSVFSVNFDPGRPWKYLGSLLLVFGTIWHFGFSRRKRLKEKRKEIHEQNNPVTHTATT